MSESTADSIRERIDIPERSSWIVLESLVVFAFGLAVMHFIYTGTETTADGRRGVPGNDSYYHIKMASLLPEYGILQEFPWLRFCYFTDEGDAFVNHHYGFHAMLAPFVTLSKQMTGDYLTGARWAMATFFGGSMVLFNLILMTGRVRWRWLWLLLFVLMPFQFFTRHAFVRAIGPSLMFMLLIVLLMFRKRFVWTGVAIAVYCHVYLGAVLFAPLLVGLYLFSCGIGSRDERANIWRILIAAGLGWSIGVAAHPYSAGIWEFLRLQVFGSGLSPDIPVGREWKPYEGLWWFARMSAAVLLVWAIALCARLRLGKPLTARELTLLLINFAFLILTLKARRFIEYWPVFCLLSAAFLAAPLMAHVADWFDHLVDHNDRGRALWLRRAGAACLAAVALTIVYGSPLWRGVRNAARCPFDLPAVSRAMSFLEEHSDPGDVVFTDDWDIFPVYFFHNSHNHYIVGLDPKFTHARRPVLWKRYVKVSRGQVPTDITVSVPDGSGGESMKTVHVTLEDIREEFGARFVITDVDHKKLAGKLAAAPDFAELIYPSKVYADSRDAPYLIFRIRNAHGP